MDIATAITDAVRKATSSAHYTRDNLLCYSVTLQPHFLVWISSLFLSTSLSEHTKALCKENAEEEMFGLESEGNHFVLSRRFFRQFGPFQTSHYEKTEQAIEDIYGQIENSRIILFVLACIEVALAEGVLMHIEAAAQEFGISDSLYLAIHRTADNVESGHSMKLVEALRNEPVTDEEIEVGTHLFVALFQAMLT